MNALKTSLAPGALAQRWGVTVPGLRAMRNRGRAPGWVKLPGGAVRYPLQGVIEAELAGAHTFRDLPAVLQAVAAVDGLSDELLAAVEIKLREAFAVEE